MMALTDNELERELIALRDMKTPALQQKWRQIFSSEPPRKMRALFLQRAIAYRLQEKAFGGLKPKTKKELDRLAQAHLQARQTGCSPEDALAAPLRRRVLSPGTQLLREWNGRAERVEVTADGFVWKDQTYRTLSAVAVAITGTKWSGPKFFGLISKAEKKGSPNNRGSTTRSSPPSEDEVLA